MPLVGWDTVTVPGAPALWADLSRRFGRLAFPDLFEPAIRYARDGAVVAPGVAELWQMIAPLFEGRADFRAAFLPGGRPPRVGERFRCEGLAETLAALAETRCRSLYEGVLAERILAHARDDGGLLCADDLAGHATSWVEPVSVGYRGYQLCEMPPNAQGLAALAAAGVLERFDAGPHADSPAWVHSQIEAMKLGIADAGRTVADPEFVREPLAELLAPSRLDSLAGGIDPARAAASPGSPGSRGDTVYVATAAADGTMVSLIQSNYLSFGSGVVVPGTGISLQSRGACFTLRAGHPNEAGPAKRPFQTLIPAFLLRDGSPVAAFGVMGGGMQPQGHLQVLTRVVDHGQNPQAALDAPRWQILDDGAIGVEAAMAPEIKAELSLRGHDLRTLDPAWFGGGQIVCRLEGGAYLAASEPRKDGHAAGF